MAKPLRVCPEEILWHPNQSPKTLIKITSIPPRRRVSWHARARLFFSGFIRLITQLGTITLAAFYIPNGLYKWLYMSHGAAGASAWVSFIIRLVTVGLNNTRKYLDEIELDDSSIHQIATTATLFALPRLHKAKLSPMKPRIGATLVDFLGHVITQESVRPKDDKAIALT